MAIRTPISCVRWLTRIGDDAVNAHGGEQQRRHGKRSREGRRQARLRRAFGDPLVQAAQVGDRLRGVDLADRRTDRRQDRLELGVCANDERDGVLGKLRRRKGRAPRSDRDRDLRRGADAVVATDVADNAHDFMAAAVELENPPDRIRRRPRAVARVPR